MASDRDWDDFAEAFPEIRELPRLSDAELLAMAEEYQRAAIADAQSQAAQEAAQQEYRA